MAWIALFGLQVGSWLAYRFMHFSEWWPSTQRLLGVASLIMAGCILVLEGFGWRRLLLVLVTLLVGQAHLLLALVAEYIWKIPPYRV